MPHPLLVILVIILLGCDNPNKRNEDSKNAADMPEASLAGRTKTDTAFQYREIMHDSTIKFKFRIIYGDYELYFDSKAISTYCDSIIKLKDERRAQYINIKQQANNQTHTLYLNNDEIILKTFTPKIINQKTKESGKSLVTASFKNICDEDKAIFFIITPDNDTVRINRMSLDGCTY